MLKYALNMLNDVVRNRAKQQVAFWWIMSTSSLRIGAHVASWKDPTQRPDGVCFSWRVIAGATKWKSLSKDGNLYVN